MLTTPQQKNIEAVKLIERSVLSVLMHEPLKRNELMKTYPAKIGSFFVSPEAVKILGVILRDTIAVVVPATIVAAHPDLTNTEWGAQTIYDSISFDAGSSFGDHIEALRLNAKRVEVYSSLQGW